MLFYEFLLDSFHHTNNNQEEFTFRELPLKDVESLSNILNIQRLNETKFKPTFDVGGAFERISNGELCFVCENNNKIVGYSWFASGNRYIPEIQFILKLSNNDFYCYNWYIIKEWRNKNIIRSIVHTAFLSLKDKRFKRAIVGYLDWNKAAERVFYKLNLKSIGFITVWYCLTLRFTNNKCKKLEAVNKGSIFDFYIKIFQYSMLIFKNKALTS